MNCRNCGAPIINTYTCEYCKSNNYDQIHRQGVPGVVKDWGVSGIPYRGEGYSGCSGYTGYSNRQEGAYSSNDYLEIRTGITGELRKRIPIVINPRLQCK
jgi:hypothetical protein